MKILVNSLLIAALIAVAIVAVLLTLGPLLLETPHKTTNVRIYKQGEYLPTSNNIVFKGEVSPPYYPTISTVPINGIYKMTATQVGITGPPGQQIRFPSKWKCWIEGNNRVCEVPK
jgi:hypothetical protein